MIIWMITINKFHNRLDKSQVPLNDQNRCKGPKKKSHFYLFLKFFS